MKIYFISLAQSRIKYNNIHNAANKMVKVHTLTFTFTFTFMCNCSNSWKKISLWIIIAKQLNQFCYFVYVTEWVYNCIDALTSFFMHQQRVKDDDKRTKIEHKWSNWFHFIETIIVNRQTVSVPFKCTVCMRFYNFFLYRFASDGYWTML